MTDISFLRWDIIYYLPVVGVALGLWLLLHRRRFVAFSAVRQIQQLRHHRPSPVRRLPTLLFLLGLAFIFVALMDPVIPFSESAIEAQGLDIVLVADLSSSMSEVMGTEGAPPVASADPNKKGFATRLEVIKIALHNFVARRKHDRLGLVVFSDNAYVISPLTFDYSYLLHYIDEIDDTLLKTEGMTAIGEGIYMANMLFAKQSDPEAKNKVVVVFTDGEYNIGRDPIQALNDTAALRVRSYMVGMDLEESVKRKPAVALLIESVKQLGGQYFQANSAQQLEKANTDISALEKGRLVGTQFVRNVPIYHWFAIPAIVLIVVAMGFRVIPYFTELT